MLINDFSGGKNIRVAPSLLQPNEAQVYTNVDNSSGALKPLKGSSTLGIDKNKYFTYYYGNSEFVSSASETSYVEYRDKLYSTGTDLQVYDGTNTYKATLDKPTSPVASDYGNSLLTTTDTTGLTLHATGYILYTCYFEHYRAFYNITTKIIHVDHYLDGTWSELLQITTPAGDPRALDIHNNMLVVADYTSATNSTKVYRYKLSLIDLAPAAEEVLDLGVHYIYSLTLGTGLMACVVSDMPTTAHVARVYVLDTAGPATVLSDDFIGNNISVSTKLGIYNSKLYVAKTGQETIIIYDIGESLEVHSSHTVLGYDFQDMCVTSDGYVYFSGLDVFAGIGNIKQLRLVDGVMTLIEDTSFWASNYILLACDKFVRTWGLSTTAWSDFNYREARGFTEIGSGDYPKGTYSYVITAYNSSLFQESQPSEISNSIVVSNSEVELVVPAITDLGFDKFRIYRVGGSLTSYTLVEEVTRVSGLPLTYLDSLKDVTIAGNHILDTYENTAAPQNLKYLTESYAMLFGASDNKLYYSDIGRPDKWPVTNFIDFSEPIKGIGKSSMGILVFLSNSIYIVSGNSPESFSKFLFSSSQGCRSHYTISYHKGAVLWLSNDGICLLEGNDIKIVTLDKLGKFEPTSVNNAVVYDSAYYLSYGTKILGLDFKYNLIINDLDLDMDWLGYYNDTLFGVSEPVLSSLLTGSSLTYTYRSPIFTEGAYTNYKRYKDVYIKYSGSITFKVYIDGVLKNSIPLTGDSVYNLKLASPSKGYSIEFEVIGTGIVNEIEYKVEGRQND